MAPDAIPIPAVVVVDQEEEQEMYPYPLEGHNQGHDPMGGGDCGGGRAGMDYERAAFLGADGITR